MMGVALAALLITHYTSPRAHAQTVKFNQLPATNAVAATNIVAVWCGPHTNGLKGVRIDNLFSNALLLGSAALGTNSTAAALWNWHKDGSNALLAVTGITNATPITNNVVSAWLPVTVNGTNYFLPLYK